MAPSMHALISRPAFRGPSRLAREIRAERLTYLSDDRLRNLERAAKAARSVPGDYVETGVALGGSSVLIGRAMPKGRTLHLYDTFGMIPPTGERDDEKSRERYEVIASGRSEGLGGDLYYGYVPDLLDKVRGTLDSYGLNGQVQLHQGLFEDSLRLDRAVAFAHIDCDWYESVKVCLERLYPVLSPGAWVICDDYLDYGGCREAVDEFLAGGAELDKISADSNLVMRRR
jgi:O-methyltransferase